MGRGTAQDRNVKKFGARKKERPEIKGQELQAPLTPPLPGRSLGQADDYLQQTVISAGCALALPVQMDTYRLCGQPIRESPKQAAAQGTGTRGSLPGAHHLLGN